MGEFTGDNYVDVAYRRQGCSIDAEVTCENDGVTILAGDGSGGFSEYVAFEAGEGPLGLLAVDLDRNGREDLLRSWSQLIAARAGLPRVT